MRNKDDYCHTEITDADGDVAPCGKPATANLHIQNDYGIEVTYPVCMECGRSEVDNA